MHVLWRRYGITRLNLNTPFEAKYVNCLKYLSHFSPETWRLNDHLIVIFKVLSKFDNFNYGFIYGLNGEGWTRNHSFNLAWKYLLVVICKNFFSFKTCRRWNFLFLQTLIITPLNRSKLGCTGWFVGCENLSLSLKRLAWFNYTALLLARL